MLQSIFGREKRRKAKINAFCDGVRDNFEKNEMWSYPVMFRRINREIAEAITKPENAPDLPFLIALRDSDAMLLAEMESQLPWTSRDEYLAFASRVRAETIAICERLRPQAIKASYDQ